LVTARARGRGPRAARGSQSRMRVDFLLWEHRRRRELLLALLRLGPKRLRLRSRAWLDTSGTGHPWLLLASDEGIEGGVGMDDMCAVGAVLAQARGLRGRTRHIMLEGSCRNRVGRRGRACLTDLVDVRAAGSVADFPTRQACLVGDKMNRPYHGHGPSSECRRRVALRGDYKSVQAAV
jgi:hypothetical protein